MVVPPADVESLLPPAATAAAPASAPRPILAPRPAADAPPAPARRILLPTPDGQVVPLEEKPKIIGRGPEEIEIKRLSAAEKARRRAIRNVVLWAVGLVGLLAFIVYMAWR
jgi:hypothetical protein